MNLKIILRRIISLVFGALGIRRLGSAAGSGFAD